MEYEIQGVEETLEVLSELDAFASSDSSANKVNIEMA